MTFCPYASLRRKSTLAARCPAEPGKPRLKSSAPSAYTYRSHPPDQKPGCPAHGEHPGQGPPPSRIEHGPRRDPGIDECGHRRAQRIRDLPRLHGVAFLAEWVLKAYDRFPADPLRCHNARRHGGPAFDAALLLVCKERRGFKEQEPENGDHRCDATHAATVARKASLPDRLHDEALVALAVTLVIEDLLPW